MSWRVVAGDCVEAMAAMAEGSVDAVVCDPPYGLEFMGVAWDTLGKGGPRGDAVFDVPGSREHPRTPDAQQRVRSKANRNMQRWHEAWAREALRVLKPGGHLLAFGGTRTYHRLVCAVEDAGFEVRDTITWLYGSGFPKSLDVSKAIDKAAGAEREVVGVSEHKSGIADGNTGEQSRDTDFAWARGRAVAAHYPITAPATEPAKRWEGWGTALKPASEPIVVGRKPLVGTVAVNVLEHDTGALNIDGCRIGYAGAADQASAIPQGRATAKAGALAGGTQNDAERAEFAPSNDRGRWPANVVLSHAVECVQVGTRRIKPIGATARTEEHGKGQMFGRGPAAHAGYRGEDGREEVELWACVPGCPVRVLDDQTGNVPGAVSNGKRVGTGYREGFGEMAQAASYGDRGGASRFFYVSKASGAERNAGLDGFERGPSAKMGAGLRSSVGASAEAHGLVAGTTSTEDRRAANVHPTVKPVELMRWLVRLVCPPGGTVLDPFCGSGTTGIAAALEGFDFVGVEREAEYVAIAEARIGWWAEQPPAASTTAVLRPRRERERAPEQERLF